MKSSRSTLRSLALLLALTGVLFRGLIPAGFMPAIGADARGGALLVLCSGGSLKAAAAATDPDGHPVAQAMDECPFAAAAAPALPPVSPPLPPLPSSASVAVRESSTGPQRAIRGRSPPVRGPPALS